MKQIELNYFKGYEDYAKANSINWRTAKKRMEKENIICLIIKWKKIYVTANELRRIIRESYE